jgi:DNA-binding CsgD family transcriptional regulator
VPDDTDITVIRDPTLVAERYQRIQRAARFRFRLLDSPPYYCGLDSPQVRRQTALQAERMAAGVEYRTIYADSVFRHPEFSAMALRQIELGELARSLPNLPMKLAVGDESVAVLSPSPTRGADGPAFVLHPSGLLTALVMMFDVLWGTAVPVVGRFPDDDIDERDRSILLLMSSGATDDTIARRLNVSRRTVVRRISALLHRLGVTNRFQAGVQAARLGWL